jgi:RNA polymerase sigma factor (sigma-70 family)
MRPHRVGSSYSEARDVTHHLLSAYIEGSHQHKNAKHDVSVLAVYLDAAYNLARWLVRDQTEAEDAVQEAYLRAIRHFATFRGGDGRAWLLAIVRNTCYDRLKQRGASAQTTDFDEAVHSCGQQTANPETGLLKAERKELLRRSLARLPAEYREVLVLRELEQFSYREIADIASIPVGTVMSRLSRARQQLQETLLASREAIDLGIGFHAMHRRGVGAGGTATVS